jgi:VanZ family protein
VRPLRYSHFWMVGGVALVLAVIVGSVGPALPPLMGHSDKLVHLGAYLTLAVWFGGVCRPARYPIVAACLLVLGGGIELVQGLLPYRSMELADMAANTTGVATGILLSWVALGSWCQWVEARLPGAR